MSTQQIAVRLPTELVEFVDGEVAAHTVDSRAELVIRALRRERRRLEALRDAQIYLTTGGQADDLDGLADYAGAVPMDID